MAIPRSGVALREHEAQAAHDDPKDHENGKLFPVHFAAVFFRFTIANEIPETATSRGMPAMFIHFRRVSSESMSLFKLRRTTRSSLFTCACFAWNFLISSC